MGTELTVDGVTGKVAVRFAYYNCRLTFIGCRSPHIALALIHIDPDHLIMMGTYEP